MAPAAHEHVLRLVRQYWRCVSNTSLLLRGSYPLSFELNLVESSGCAALSRCPPVRSLHLILFIALQPSLPFQPSSRGKVLCTFQCTAHDQPFFVYTLFTCLPLSRSACATHGSWVDYTKNTRISLNSRALTSGRLLCLQVNPMPVVYTSTSKRAKENMNASQARSWGRVLPATLQILTSLLFNS
eukprot:1161301-Pelagomonas_calceolata.AAC.17